MPFTIIPAIDLKQGRCVRLSQGEASSVKIYEADPIAIAKSFQKAGADMLHLVDLDGAFADCESPNRNIVKEIINEVDMRVEVGGGIRKVEDVEQLIDIGVAHVILGTLAVESSQILSSLVEQFGARICVGIDARDGKVMTRGWVQGTDTNAIDFARAVSAIGVQRVIYTDISRDGMLCGLNVEQTCAIARAAQIHVTASGGVSSLDDIRQLKDASEPLVDSVIVGKALYEGRFKLEDALEIAA